MRAALTLALPLVCRGGPELPGGQEGQLKEINGVGEPSPASPPGTRLEMSAGCPPPCQVALIGQKLLELPLDFSFHSSPGLVRDWDDVQ